MARIDNNGYSDKALQALLSGNYKGRTPSLRSSSDQLKLVGSVPALLGMKKSAQSAVPQTKEKTKQKTQKLGMSNKALLESSKKNISTAEALNELTRQITGLPANSDLTPEQKKAVKYQNNLAKEAEKYQYDKKAMKANTLDKEDSAYLQRIFDRYGDGEITRRSLQESNQTQGWEQKYGKSLDQIYKDFLADQGNVKMDLAERHPFMAELGTIAANIPTSVATLPSLVGNIVAPESEFAQRAEEARRQNEENRKYYRAGIKETTGETGGKVLDTVNTVADRMASTLAGKALGGSVGGGVLAGLSDANQQMENLNMRDMSERQRALSALAHGTVEGIGTGITAGILDNLPAVEGLKGSLLNILKGAGNAAFENGISEVIEMGADTAINQENSQKELNKQIYMLQGMSEEEAEHAAKMDQVKQGAMAAGTGALFGGGMTGLSQLGRKAGDAVTNKLIPALTKLFAKSAESAEDAKVQAEAPVNKVPDMVENAQNQARAEVEEPVRQQLTDEQKAALQQELNEELGWGSTESETLGESALPNRWGRTADSMIAEDSYARAEDFKKLENNIRDLNEQIFDIKDRLYALRQERDANAGRIQLTKDDLETMQSMDAEDRMAYIEKATGIDMGEIGAADLEYLLEGRAIKKSSAKTDEINSQIKDLETQRTELEKQLSLLEEDRDYIKANERLAQLENYTSNEFVPATREKYQGFSTTKGEHNDEIGKGAQLVEMTPDEYIQRCVYEVFEESDTDSPATLESVLSSRYQSKVDDYAQKMREGAEFPTPYIDYTSGFNQEGLHRALAAKEAGIDVMPVVVKGSPIDSRLLGSNAKSRRAEIDLARSDRELEKLGFEELVDEDWLDEDIDSAVADSVGTEITGESAHIETLNNTGIPKSVSEQIAEEIQKDNFAPVTYTDADGYTHVLTRSTRDGEKWQVSHLDETGRAVGHNAYADDADLLNKLKTDDRMGNLVEINTKNNILTQPEVTINDMVNNPDAFSLEDFGRALKTLDRNADTYDASKEDLIEALLFNMNEEPDTGKITVKVSPETYSSVASDAGIDATPKVTETVEPEVKPQAEEPTIQKNPNQGEYKIPNSDEPKPPEEKIRSFSERGSEDETLPEEIRNSLSEDTYKVLRNTETAARAEEMFDPDNLTQTRSNLTQAVKEHDPASALLSYKLAKAYVDEGNYDAATDVIEEVSAELTRMGQFTQAARLAMMQNDPMAALRSYERDLRNLNRWGKEKYGKKWNNLKLSEEDVKLFDGIQKGDKDALNSVVDQLNTKFGKQIPASWWDKTVAASKTAMLLNPRTQFKNILANMASLPLRSMSDRVSALGQGATYLIKKMVDPDTDFKRTQSLTGGTRQQKKVATEIWDRLKDEISSDNKMKDSAKSDILSHRQTFNDDFFAKWIDNMTGGGIQKLNEKLGADANKSTMETLQNFTYWLMGDFGDTPFVKKNFVNRLASYMKAQGIENVEDVPDDAISIATQEALKATFKDDNAFTKALQGVKQKTGKFGEVALPFVKTPANLTMRAIDYSPAGIINTIRKAKNGAEASAVIDELGKNLTGSALIYLGYKLAEKGIISGTYSKNKSEAAFQKQQGMLEYALHIGDNYYTYDWAEPAATPLVIGTTIYEAIKNSDDENATLEDVINGIFKGGLNVANTLINSSPLQSLSDLLGSDGNDEGGIAANFANEIMEFPQRLIPSMLGAAARTIDPVLRDTYVADDTLTGAIGNQIRQAEAKIPFLSKTLPASYDTWGNERTRSDTKGEAFVAQMVNPGQLGNKNETPLDAEIQRLFDATGSQSVFPLFAARSLDLGSDGHKTLTNKEHSDYQREMGQKSYKMAETFMNSPEYDSLTDDEKASALNTIYGLSNALTKEELFGHETSTDKKLKEIYKTEGVEAAVNYIVDRKKADRLGINVDTYLKKQAEYEGGVDQYVADKAEADKLGLSVDTYNKKNAEYEGGATQYAEDKKTAESFGITADKFEKMKSKAGSYSDKAVDALPVLQGMGFSNPYVAADYANASAKVPGLDINTFATNFRRMDGNSDDTLTQKEVTNYLNNNNVDDATAQTLWLYGNFHKSGDPTKETKLKRNKNNKWVSYYD